MTLTSFAKRVIESVLSAPVFVKVMGIALGLTVLLAGSMFWQIHETWHGIAQQDLESRAVLIGKDISARALEHLLEGRLSDVQQMLNSIRSHNPEIAYLLVLEEQGRAVAHTLPGQPSEEMLRANMPGAQEETRIARLQNEYGEVRDIAVRLPGSPGGVVRIGMTEERVDRNVAWLTRRLARLTAIIAAVGIAAAWWLTRVLTRPINELVGAARSVREGDYRARAPVRASDEVGELATAFNQMTSALQAKETMRRRLQRQAIESAEEERKRLARELHDQTGQALTSLIAGLGALETNLTDTAGSEKVTMLRRLASQTLGEVQAVSLALRPSVLDDQGLVAALKRHCELFGSRSGIEVDCEAVGLDGGMRLPPEIETALYRIVQESLANALRHGRASMVHVLLQRMSSRVLVVIEDNGEGFDAGDWRTHCLRDNHLGLLGIEERAALLDGTLQVESSPGAGTRLFVEVPLRVEPEPISHA